MKQRRGSFRSSGEAPQAAEPMIRQNSSFSNIWPSSRSTKGRTTNPHRPQQHQQHQRRSSSVSSRKPSSQQQRHQRYMDNRFNPVQEEKSRSAFFMDKLKNGRRKQKKYVTQMGSTRKSILQGILKERAYSSPYDENYEDDDYDDDIRYYRQDYDHDYSSEGPSAGSTTLDRSEWSSSYESVIPICCTVTEAANVIEYAWRDGQDSSSDSSNQDVTVDDDDDDDDDDTFSKDDDETTESDQEHKHEMQQVRRTISNTVDRRGAYSRSFSAKVSPNLNIERAQALARALKKQNFREMEL
mmetsp:Transcript_17360/g.47394  ORF Transcript_17360/g.47394 Transcript_17360/m.47394 type:complete len:298 (-) Transcript_17360:44-937(-)